MKSFCGTGEVMPPTGLRMKDNSCKPRDHCYWNTSWRNSLKEICCFLPVSEAVNGRALSKKETLIHMLQYFDFLQTHIQRLHDHLPQHCLPADSHDREESDSESEDADHTDPRTPPCILKAKRKYSCGRPRKKDTANSELFDGNVHTLREEDADGIVTPISKGEYSQDTDETVCSLEENSSLPCSSDSSYSVSALLPPTTSSSTTESSVDQESPCNGLESQCSICDDRTESENGSQESKEITSPPSGSRSFVLKDRMFGVLPPLGKKQPDDSPTLPQTPLLPFLPLLGFREGLNLSPSLLTSPARGLGHTLLPEGQEELQTLFEDVWVNPKPTAPKLCTPGRDRHTCSQGHDEESCSDDITWTPNQRTHAKKKAQKSCRKGRAVPGQSQKKKSHPGLPSTVVTKELANLWHVMPKHERRVYCLKARQFSRLHNRNVRSNDQEEEEEEEDCVLSPLHMLLAQKDMRSNS